MNRLKEIFVGIDYEKAKSATCQIKKTQQMFFYFIKTVIHIIFTIGSNNFVEMICHQDILCHSSATKDWSSRGKKN